MKDRAFQPGKLEGEFYILANRKKDETPEQFAERFQEELSQRWLRVFEKSLLSGVSEGIFFTGTFTKADGSKIVFKGPEQKE